MTFKPNSVKEAEEDYTRLHIVPDQKYIVIAIGKLVSNYIPLPERAIRGLIWRTIREWQLVYKKDVSELSNMSSVDRVEAVVQIVKIFETTMKRILIDKEQEPALEEAMKKTLDMYNEKFSNR